MKVKTAIYVFITLLGLICFVAGMYIGQPLLENPLLAIGSILFLGGVFTIAWAVTNPHVEVRKK